MKPSVISFVLHLLFISTVQGQSRAIIGGHLDNFTGDSVMIFLRLNDIIHEAKIYSIPVKDGKFEQEISIGKPTFISFSDGKNYLNGLIEPGDNIQIKYDANSIDNSLRFEGKGSERYSFCIRLLKYNLTEKVRNEVTSAKSTKSPFDHLLKFADHAEISLMDCLSAIKSSMSTESFMLLAADIKATLLYNKFRSATMVYHESIEETLEKRKSELTTYSREFLSNVLTFDQTLSNSPTYINTVYNILFIHFDSQVLAGKATKNLIEKYIYLSKILPQKLETPVLTLFIERDISKLNQAEDLKTLIKQIYSNPADSVYKEYIEKRYQDAITFEKGMTAPEFILENEKGEKVSLSSFKGKVVYLDFWYGACGPCHAKFQTIKPVKKHFQSHQDIVFLNISTDTKQVWEAALKKFKVAGYNVFTENKGTNHPAIKSYKVVSYPTTCLIDRNGKFFSLTPSDNADQLTTQIESVLQIGKN